MIYNMFWYFISAVGFLSCAGKLRFPVMFLVTLSMLSGFRYFVGSDYYNYYNAYITLSSGYDLSVIMDSYFSLLVVALSNLGLNFQSLFLVHSLITFLLIYLTLKKEFQNILLFSIASFFVFITFYFPSLSIIRQALASTIACYAAYTYLPKNKFKFLALVVLSFFIHFSSFIYILLLIFNKRRFTSISYALLIILFFALGISVSGNIIYYLASNLGVSFKSYDFSPTPFPGISYVANTVFTISIFILALKCKNKLHAFEVNAVFFMVAFRLLALDFIHFTRLSAAFNLFFVIVCSKLIFFYYKFLGRGIVFGSLLSLALIRSYQVSSKDYSYFQYSYNLCIFGAPCPIVVYGDKLVGELETPAWAE